MVLLLRVTPVLCVLATMASVAHAASETEPAWSGRADAGFFSQSGTGGGKESLTLKAEATRRAGEFVWENRAQIVSAKDDNTNSGTERYLLQSKQRWDYSKTDFVFVQEQFEKDSTSSFDYQANLTAGYGRKLIDATPHKLIGELGAGVRHSERRIGQAETRPIATGALDYHYAISDTAGFGQRLAVETGSDSTIVRSVSELRVKLNGALSFSVAYDIKREYSQQDQRLSLTTINLGYTF